MDKPCKRKKMHLTPGLKAKLFSILIFLTIIVGTFVVYSAVKSHLDEDYKTDGTLNTVKPSTNDVKPNNNQELLDQPSKSLDVPGKEQDKNEGKNKETEKKKDEEKEKEMEMEKGNGKESNPESSLPVNTVDHETDNDEEYSEAEDEEKDGDDERESISSEISSLTSSSTSGSYSSTPDTSDKSGSKSTIHISEETSPPPLLAPSPPPPKPVKWKSIEFIGAKIFPKNFSFCSAHRLIPEDTEQKPAYFFEISTRKDAEFIFTKTEKVLKVASMKAPIDQIKNILELISAPGTTFTIRFYNNFFIFVSSAKKHLNVDKGVVETGVIDIVHEYLTTMKKSRELFFDDFEKFISSKRIVDVTKADLDIKILVTSSKEAMLSNNFDLTTYVPTDFNFELVDEPKFNFIKGAIINEAICTKSHVFSTASNRLVYYFQISRPYESSNYNFEIYR